MKWTARQRLMLQEMGIRLWAPIARTEAAAPATRVTSSVAVAMPPPQPSAEGAAHAAANPNPGLAAPKQAPAVVSVPVDVSAPGQEDRVSAVARMAWPELREAVAACRACALCQGRRQTVFGVGHARAHWMIVGEAPGEQEDLQGEPFVGPSGQLLDNMLRALGLTRDEASPERQVYIANTLKCRPPRNRNPELQELLQCEPFLVRQIALVRPRLILAMGRFAVQALLRSDEPVGKLRGRVHRYQGVPLVVTYHPAYLLRNPADKARAWDDLCLAARTAEAVDAGPTATAAAAQPQPQP